MPQAQPNAAIRGLNRPAGAAAGYLYAENGNSTIGAFSIAKSGALTALSGSPFDSDTTGPGPFAIAVNPEGPYLYTTGTISDNVAVFSIGSRGALTAVSSSTSAGGGASATVLTKSDNRLYVVDGSGDTIAAFDLKKGGKLKAVSGSPFAVSCPGFCDANPIEVVMSGAYLYAVDQYGWYVSAFSIAHDGALTELNSYATDYGPNDAVMTPNGADLYVTNGASANVSAYSVADGVLTQLTGSPFAAGGTPAGIAMTHNGKLLYVANQGDGTISGYAIGAGGALTALSGSPFADGTDTGPGALTVDQANKHLFVANGGSGAIAVYTIDSSGRLAQITGSPFSDSGGPKGLALYEP